MRSSNDLILGYDAQGNSVTLPRHLLNRHTYVAGRSGSGKSKLLEAIIRQLLVTWPCSRSGMLVIDPHAALYDAVMAHLASSGYDHLPVVPFDLRSDWICSLNVLRPRPGFDPAPLMHAAVRAVLHGWQQSNSTDTPRLTKWLTTIFTTLYSSGCTVLETLDIIRSPEIRTAMARQVEDAMAKSVWIVAGAAKESTFQEELSSTMNRMGRFLSTQVLKLAFGQSDVSLDMLAAMERGQIVLASLATEGSRIAEEDAAVVGSLLVNEVWCAAKHRGKRENGKHRQFTVVIDEFQEFVSPVIAQSLAQLRGMGVGFIAAQQSPQQLLDLGPMGRQVLNAILSNTATQVIFQMSHPADLDLIVPYMYRGVVTDEVKFQPHSTKVLDYDLQYLESTSRSTTYGTSYSRNWSTTESAARSTGKSRSHSDSHGTSRGTQSGHSVGHNEAVSRGVGRSHAESVAQSEAQGTTESRALGQSRGRSESNSESRGLDGEYDDLAKVVGPEPTATFDRAYVDEDEEHRGLHRTIGKSASKSTSEADSESSGQASTRSTSSARAQQESQSHTESESLGRSDSLSSGENTSASAQISDSVATSESISAGIAQTTGGGCTDSESVTEGVTRSPMLMPRIGKEALPPMFRAVEEQLFRCSQQMFGLPDRHAIVRTGTTPPVEITTPTLRPASMSAKGVRAWANLKLKRLAFALPAEEATRRLAERRRQFEAKYLGLTDTDEPRTLVRRIKE